MPRSSRRAELGLRFQDDGAGAVAEQHAGAAILPVEDARERLGADHDGALELPGLEEVVGDGERVDEARAHRLHVEGRALGDAEPGLDAHGGGREGAIGRGGGADDEIDVDRVDAGAHQRLTRGGDAEIGGQLAVGSDVALRDAGPLLDPLIAGVDHAGQVVVGHDALGQVGADAADHGSDDCHVSPHVVGRTTAASGATSPPARSPRPICRATLRGPWPGARARRFPPNCSRPRWRWRSRRHRCRRGS